VVFVQLESVTGTHRVDVAAAINKCGAAAVNRCGATAVNRCGATACTVAGAGGTRTTASARGPGNGNRGSDAQA
jgi:hypothetical protein